MAAKGEKVILVRRETSPEDVGGMFVAQGIVTATVERRAMRQSCARMGQVLHCGLRTARYRLCNKDRVGERAEDPRGRLDDARWK